MYKRGIRMKKNKVVLIRPAGSMMSIDEAMKQCKEFKNEKELNDFLVSQAKEMIKFFGACEWEVEKYDNEYDERIGWPYTDIVCLNGMGWYFMTSGITKKESLKILKGE